MLKVAKPTFNGRARLEDAFVVTPSSDAKAVKKMAGQEDVPYTVVVISQAPGTMRRSSTPTEMVTESNSNEAVSIPFHFVPSPGGLIFTGLKFARSKFGLRIPGFRPHMSLDQEVKNNGTDALAETTYEIGHAKKDHDKEQVQELTQKRRSLQNETFGTTACWKAQEKKLATIVDKAIDAEVIDSSYKKPFAVSDMKNRILRMIPMVQLKPSQGKLVNSVMTSPNTEVENSEDGLVLEKNGVTAGLTRNNVSMHDQKLGFLILASAIDFDLGEAADRRPNVADFDSDWALMITVGKNAGIALDASDASDMGSCVAQSE
jgi:hypothetical protein